MISIDYMLKNINILYLACDNWVSNPSISHIQGIMTTGNIILFIYFFA